MIINAALQKLVLRHIVSLHGFPQARNQRFPSPHFLSDKEIICGILRKPYCDYTHNTVQWGENRRGRVDGNRRKMRLDLGVLTK